MGLFLKIYLKVVVFQVICVHGSVSQADVPGRFHGLVSSEQPLLFPLQFKIRFYYLSLVSRF